MVTFRRYAFVVIWGLSTVSPHVMPWPRVFSLKVLASFDILTLAVASKCWPRVFVSLGLKLMA